MKQATQRLDLVDDADSLILLSITTDQSKCVVPSRLTTLFTFHSVNFSCISYWAVFSYYFYDWTRHFF